MHSNRHGAGDRRLARDAVPEVLRVSRSVERVVVFELVMYVSHVIRITLKQNSCSAACSTHTQHWLFFARRETDGGHVKNFYVDVDATAGDSDAWTAALVGVATGAAFIRASEEDRAIPTV